MLDPRLNGERNTDAGGVTQESHAGEGISGDLEPIVNQTPDIFWGRILASL